MVSLQADIKQLEDLNQVTIMLGCEEEFKITDEKAVILLRKKLLGFKSPHEICAQWMKVPVDSDDGRDSRVISLNTIDEKVVSSTQSTS